jgi:hypothetical protein
MDMNIASPKRKQKHTSVHMHLRTATTKKKFWEELVRCLTYIILKKLK